MLLNGSGGEIDDNGDNASIAEWLKDLKGEMIFMKRLLKWIERLF